MAESETFLTSVKKVDPNATQFSQVSSGQDRGEHTFRIENAHPPTELTGDFEDLPSNVSIRRIIDNLKKGQHFADKRQEDKWLQYFETAESKSIICDSFWYVICKCFHPDTSRGIDVQLRDRIAYHYVQLFVNVHPADKGPFFSNYFDLVAQATLYAMFFAYPKSRSKFNTLEFQRDLYKLFAEMFTGLKVCNKSYSAWRLDLGAGNVLRKEDKAKDKQGLLPPLEEHKVSHRMVLDMRYSPLVQQYLQTRKYAAINAVKPWRMLYTLRNEEREQQIDRRFQSFVKLAVETEEKCKQRALEYTKLSNQVDLELKENHRHAQDVIRVRAKSIRKTLEDDPHEYANILVSLHQKEKMEKGSRLRTPY